MKVVIMSGISGAGKSTYIRENYPDSIVCSADQFFVREGKYSFDADCSAVSAGACMRDFISALRACEDYADVGVSPPTIVVDNTNTTNEEIAPYYSVAKAFGAKVEIVTLRCDPEVAAARNVHGVPLAGVVAMARRISARRLPPFWEVFLQFHGAWEER